MTPLRIGSGQTLERNFDYAVLTPNLESLIWMPLPNRAGRRGSRFERMLQTVPPGQLLQKEDFQPNSPLFRYVLRGVPRAAATGAAIQAHVKNVYDQPYIPGSSLKGALRTLLLRHAYAESRLKLSATNLNHSRSWAAQNLERELLGRDPNHDLLRGLHISDSTPLQADQLLLLPAQVFGRRAAGAPIDIECVRGDAIFSATLAIDDYLFENPEAQQLLKFGSKRDWLTNLPQLAHTQATERIKEEIAFYKARPGSRAASFYRQLAGLTKQMPAASFLLQVGWGGGWDSKTLGYLISPEDRSALVDRYRLGRGQYDKNKPFPSSRRAIARGTGDTAEPQVPLGWLLVEMKGRK
ncbi:MAG: type III-A CRISPR-associated RAMP protein Csm5 [Chloroflexota bacterium]